MIHKAGSIITQSLEPFESVRDRRSNKQQQTALHHGQSILSALLSSTEAGALASPLRHLKTPRGHAM